MKILKRQNWPSSNLATGISLSDRILVFVELFYFLLVYVVSV